MYSHTKQKFLENRYGLLLWIYKLLAHDIELRSERAISIVLEINCLWNHDEFRIKWMVRLVRCIFLFVFQRENLNNIEIDLSHGDRNYFIIIILVGRKKYMKRIKHLHLCQIEQSSKIKSEKQNHYLKNDPYRKRRVSQWNGSVEKKNKSKMNILNLIIVRIYVFAHELHGRNIAPIIWYLDIKKNRCIESSQSVLSRNTTWACDS